MGCARRPGLRIDERPHPQSAHTKRFIIAPENRQVELEDAFVSHSLGPEADVVDRRN